MKTWHSNGGLYSDKKMTKTEVSINAQRKARAFVDALAMLKLINDLDEMTIRHKVDRNWRQVLVGYAFLKKVGNKYFVEEILRHIHKYYNAQFEPLFNAMYQDVKDLTKANDLKRKQRREEAKKQAEKQVEQLEQMVKEKPKGLWSHIPARNEEGTLTDRERWLQDLEDSKKLRDEYRDYLKWSESILKEFQKRLILSTNEPSIKKVLSPEMAEKEAVALLTSLGYFIGRSIKEEV